MWGGVSNFLYKEIAHPIIFVIHAENIEYFI
jgi:hypothetical protein